MNWLKKETGFGYIFLALMAFAGLGLEAVLAFALEPMLYGCQMADWNTPQNILHWTMTCILWGLTAFALIRFIKNAYGLDLLARGAKVKPWQWLLVVVFVISSLIFSYIDWDGSKVIKEFLYNGWLKFIFQYIYYIFETVLVMLILIFGQKAFEKWFRRENIPYGGIILALTWGFAHFFTKDFSTGIWCMISGLAFGSVYLLVNRDLRKAFPILFIMFVL